jgi:hypothetical protein
MTLESSQTNTSVMHFSSKRFIFLMYSGMSIELLSEGNNITWWFYNWEVFLGEAKHCQQHISKGKF